MTKGRVLSCTDVFITPFTSSDALKAKLAEGNTFTTFITSKPVTEEEETPEDNTDSSDDEEFDAEWARAQQIIAESLVEEIEEV